MNEETKILGPLQNTKPQNTPRILSRNQNTKNKKTADFLFFFCILVLGEDSGCILGRILGYSVGGPGVRKNRSTTGQQWVSGGGGNVKIKSKIYFHPTPLVLIFDRFQFSGLVAPYCAIPRDHLSDTPLLRAMGFLVSRHGQLGAIPLPLF